jgi:hypothetical protein
MNICQKILHGGYEWQRIMQKREPHSFSGIGQNIIASCNGDRDPVSPLYLSLPIIYKKHTRAKQPYFAGFHIRKTCFSDCV